MRDTDGDGVADLERRFDDTEGTGLHVHGEHLYLSTKNEVFRYHLGAGLVPTGERQTIVSGMPGGHSHDSKSLAFDQYGNMYVNHGSPSNACQRSPRSPGSRGR